MHGARAPAASFTHSRMSSSVWSPLAPAGGNGHLSACHFADELHLKDEQELLGEA
ncbi:MAG: hypothetical protein OXC31_16120 [Spirochaetaceae bacterium]|nr:hypothetical protein [Spirochaetaceae bacterium]